MPTSLRSTRPDPYKDYTLFLWDGVNTYFGSKVTGLVPPEVVRHRPGDDPSTSFKSPGGLTYEPVTLDRGVTGDPSFSAWAGQVTAVLSEPDPAEYRQGDDGGLSPRKLTGRSKFDDVTLTRGITQDQSFSNWANSVSSYGSNPGAQVSPASFRKDIILEFYSEAGQLVVRYQINPRRVLEFRGGGHGVFYHPLSTGGPRRLREQLAEIFEDSLDAKQTSGPQ
ncbi:MAG TPA: phage tail protein [Bryobacteraceae bacterium]|nr:phage tail protein [Bryobacteraceae bacterium]